MLSAIKTAIVRTYNITKETYRKYLKLSIGETPVELVTHLQDLHGREMAKARHDWGRT